MNQNEKQNSVPKSVVFGPFHGIFRTFRLISFYLDVKPKTWLFKFQLIASSLRTEFFEKFFQRMLFGLFQDILFLPAWAANIKAV